MKTQTIANVKNTAQTLLADFQSGKIDRDQLYSAGFELTLTYNQLVNDALSDPEYQDALKTAELLHAIRCASTQP